MEMNLKPLGGCCMDNAYELRLYDTPLITFTLEEQGIAGLVAETTNIDYAKICQADIR